MKVADNPRRDFAVVEEHRYGVWTQLDGDDLHVMVVTSNAGIAAGQHPLDSSPIAVLDYDAAHDLLGVLSVYLQQRPQPPKPRDPNAVDFPGAATGFDK